MRRRICWDGWQGLRLGVGARGVSTRAVLGVGISYGGWMGMSGTGVAWDGDNGVSNRCELRFTSILDGVCRDVLER